MNLKDKILIIAGVAIVSLAIGMYSGHRFKQCPPDASERIYMLEDSMAKKDSLIKEIERKFVRAVAEADAMAAALEAYKSSRPDIKTRVKHAQRLLNDASFATVIDSAFAEPESIPWLEPSAR